VDFVLWFAVEVILWVFLLLEFCGFLISVGLLLLFVFGVVGVSSFLLLPLLLSGWGEFVGFCEYSNYGDVQQRFDDEEEQQLLELVGV